MQAGGPEEVPGPEGGGDPPLQGPEEPALGSLHPLGGAHGHLGGGGLGEAVDRHGLPGLLHPLGAGDPVGALLQAGGALLEDLPLSQQEGGVRDLLHRRVHRLGVGDLLHRADGEQGPLLRGGLPGSGELGGQGGAGRPRLVPGLGQPGLEGPAVQQAGVGGEVDFLHPQGVGEGGLHGEGGGVPVLLGLEGLVNGRLAGAGPHRHPVHGEDVGRLHLVHRLHQAGGELGGGLDLPLGGDGQGHRGLLGIGVVLPENVGDLVLHLGHGGLVGVLPLDIGQRPGAVGGHRVAQGAGGHHHRPGHREPRQPQQHPGQHPSSPLPGDLPGDGGGRVRPPPGAVAGGGRGSGSLQRITPL